MNVPEQHLKLVKAEMAGHNEMELSHINDISTTGPLPAQSTRKLTVTLEATHSHQSFGCRE